MRTNPLTFFYIYFGGIFKMQTIAIVRFLSPRAINNLTLQSRIHVYYSSIKWPGARSINPDTQDTEAGGMQIQILPVD